MGRIVSTIDTEHEGAVEVWTGSPAPGRIHIGSDGDDRPALSLTTTEAERLAVALMAARARLLGWSQTLIDQDVVLEAVDVGVLETGCRMAEGER